MELAKQLFAEPGSGSREKKKEKRKPREGQPSRTCRLNSVKTLLSAEKLINLGTLAGLIELHQFACQTLLLGLTNGHQLTVQ